MSNDIRDQLLSVMEIGTKLYETLKIEHFVEPQKSAIVQDLEMKIITNDEIIIIIIFIQSPISNVHRGTSSVDHITKCIYNN